MNKTALFTIGLLILITTSACSTDMGSMTPIAGAPEAIAPAPMDPDAASAVKLEQSLHFPGPADADVLVPAGQYQVLAGEESQLKLTSKHQPEPIVLDAITLSHGETTNVPMARMLSGEQDTQHLALLLPGGKGLVASGSESGVARRGFASRLGGIKTLEAPKPIRDIYFPPSGWIKATGGTIPQEAVPAGRNRFGSVYICRGSLPPWPGSIWVGGLWAGSGGCRTKNGLVTSYEVLAPIWTYASNGTVPADAKGSGGEGSGGPLYTCRAYYDGGWLAGKIRQGFGGCFVGWNGQEISVSGYDVLIKSFVSQSGAGADQTLSPETIQRAMPLGKSTKDGQTGAPCQALHSGGMHPGRLSWADQACDIGWGGKQVNVRQFSTFQSWWRSGIDGRSLVAGKVANDPKPQLYACRYVTQGSHETVVGYISHNFGTCEFVYPDGTANGRENSNIILADEYKEVNPNWDPAVR